MLEHENVKPEDKENLESDLIKAKTVLENSESDQWVL